MDVVVKRAKVLVAVFNLDLLRSIQLWDGSRVFQLPDTTSFVESAFLF
jgi:hypothetical protein